MGKVVAQTLEESGGASFMRILESGLLSEVLEWGPMLKDIVEVKEWKRNEVQWSSGA